MSDYRQLDLSGHRRGTVSTPRPWSWNAVRAEIDTRQESGPFILTGSATPADDITRHSGAGRFTRVRTHPVGKLIIGSNAQRILLDASCPVLAVTAGVEG